MTRRDALARVVHVIWGAPQCALGLFVYLCCLLRGRRHLGYRTALVSFWGLNRGLSLGLFVFVPAALSARTTKRLIVHEYGHTIQSLMLGPLYLPLIMLPSLVWAGLPTLERRRREKSISYYSFYTERWANRLALRHTGDLPEGATNVRPSGKRTS
jgi:hypothetical protein